MKKISLVDQLQNELDNLYHNATLNGKLRTESDYEADLYDEQLRDLIEMEFADLKYNCPNILKYGDVYQWGRGGRTVAPISLISRRGYSSFRIKRVEDLNMNAIQLRQLLKDLKAFNAYVHNWCNSTPDAIIEDIRQQHADTLKANKNKKRKTRTVVSYE